MSATERLILAELETCQKARDQYKRSFECIKSMLDSREEELRFVKGILDRTTADLDRELARAASGRGGPA